MSNKEHLQLERGFLPAQDPLPTLPEKYALWDRIGRELPKLLITDQLHSTFNDLPILSVAELKTQAELERAMILLSFFGHAYVFGQEVQDALPAAISIPWHAVSEQLGRPPVLSYASYALNNWRRIDNSRPVELGNITLLQNFLGGIDEEWFVLIHVDIEMKAASALQLFFLVQEAVKNDQVDKTLDYLNDIKMTLDNMCRVLSRMPEHCDPYIYYNRVRPYIHGWKDNPALGRGLIYQGVAAYHNQPQQFRGETGAQSSIIPSFDALFGIVHEADPLRVYLAEMRGYMPTQHRQFIAKIEQQGAIRDFILNHHRSCPALKEVYNECLMLLSDFRKTHLHYAAQYIQKQSQTSIANPTAVGTGGTPFMQYLRKHKDETLNFLI